jgi:hypothetical protein
VQNFLVKRFGPKRRLLITMPKKAETTLNHIANVEDFIAAIDAADPASQQQRIAALGALVGGGRMPFILVRFFRRGLPTARFAPKETITNNTPILTL